jgi:hypothetical protein
MNKGGGGPHIEEAPPKRTSLYLKIEEVKPFIWFSKDWAKRKSHYSFDVGWQQQQQDAKHVHIRDVGKPKEMSKNSKHPHPHGNLNHKVDDRCYKFNKGVWGHAQESNIT